MCTNFSMDIYFLFLLGIYWGVELLCHGKSKSQLKFLRNCWTFLQSVQNTLQCCQQYVCMCAKSPQLWLAIWGLQFCHIKSTLVIVSFWIFKICSHPCEYEVTSHCHFDLYLSQWMSSIFSYAYWLFYILFREIIYLIMLSVIVQL